MIRSSLTKIVVLMACGLVGGCAATAEKYQRPAVAMPATWQNGAKDPANWPSLEWWKGFNSAELDQLIAEAQNNNHDLKAAVARIRQSRAGARIAGAGLYPTIEVAAAANRTKIPGKNAVNRYNVVPQASYEIDIWGGNRHISDAAENALLSSIYGHEVVRLALTADVANTYFQILSLNDRIDVAQRNLANAVKLMELVEAQKRAGVTSLFDIERQKTQLATAEAVLPPLRQQLQVARDALAILLGKTPEDLAVISPSLQPLTVPSLPVGIPAELLDRRPDIRRAEADLLAANANIGAARAALYPKLTLGLQGGTEANQLGSLFSAGSGVYSIGLDLLATIFDGGRRRGQVDLALARKTELAENYQKSILSALADVEDALAGARQFTAQEKAQREAAAHAREAYRLAELRLRAGAIDFTAVLDAERTLLSAETAEDQARLSRFSAMVNLYRALGGGWRAVDISGK